MAEYGKSGEIRGNEVLMLGPPIKRYPISPAIHRSRYQHLRDEKSVKFRLIRGKEIRKTGFGGMVQDEQEYADIDPTQLSSKAMRS